MDRHLLRLFQRAAVLQIHGDPGCPEGVTADVGRHVLQEEHSMSMIPYTREQWNHLIRQGDPEAGHALGGDLAAWRPKVERICASHGLALDSEMQWRSSGASVRCTNAVFLSGDLAVKVFARRSPIWFRRE